MSTIELVERGWVPDPVVRLGIRRRVAARLRDEERRASAGGPAHRDRFLDGLRSSPIAVHTADANRQHYELPPAFFEEVLGPHLKYSCGWWPSEGASLAAAEAAMLDLYLDRARLADGQEVLDLGCGWGSLSLFLAARFPRSRILGVSNSADQRRFILARAAERGLANLEIRTADVNVFDPGRRLDRVVSIEMFEHLKNHEALLGRVAAWLRPDGYLFVHHFAHRRHAYHYEAEVRTMDGPALLHRRHHALGRSSRPLRPGPEGAGELVGDRHPLRPHRRGLVGQPGRAPGPGDPGTGPGLR